MGGGVSTEVESFLEERMQVVASQSVPQQDKEPHSKTTTLQLRIHGSSIRDLALSFFSRRISADSSSSSFGTSRVKLDSKRKFPVLKLQIQDDSDWIQVDESDEDTVLSPRMKSSTLAKQSYVFTSSGTFQYAGLTEGIGHRGLKSVGDEDYSGRVPMHERLVILSQLGSGASSVVYKAFDLVDMKIVALKKISVFDQGKRRQMARELELLLAMFGRASNCKSCRLNRREFGIGVIYERPGSGSSSIDDSFEDPKIEGFSENIVEFYDAFSDLDEGGIALMMEYMDGGSLQELVDLGGVASEQLLASIAFQAFSGLNFLHVNNRLHRDIKPANLLINHKGFVKISDLGIAKELQGTEGSQGPVPLLCEHGDLKDLEHSFDYGEQNVGGMRKTHTFVGTAAFMAPERIDGREYSFPSDVWALGLVILTLAQGHLPIDTGGGFWSILHQVRDLPPPTLDESRDWSAGFRDFINSCLRRDPNKRASCTELLTHRFLERRCLDEPEPAAAPHAREEVQAVLRSLADHIRTVASAEGGGQKDASALLHSLLYARGGGSLDDSCVNPRLAELCGQLSITETECLLYFKEFMIAFNAEFSIV